MSLKSIVLIFILLVTIFRQSSEYKFMRRIEAVGDPYYEILMFLGTCKDTVLYNDQKIWGKVPMNRVLDIYYKSNMPIFTVSRVEIMLIINSTNTIAYSETGVGSNEFYGTLYLPLNIGFIIYDLTIYTCVKTPNAFSATTTRTTTIKNTKGYLRFIKAQSSEEPT